MTKFTGTFPLYKKTGAAKFSMIRPRYSSVDGKGNQKVEKNGAILLEVAKNSGRKDNYGNDIYSWQDAKISFAIGLPDIAQIFENPEAGVKLFHKQEGLGLNGGDLIKKLELLPGEGRYVGTFRLMLSESGGGNDRSVMVPISAGEHQLLLSMLIRSCNKLVAWE